MNDDIPAPELVRLRSQLRVLIPVLTVGEGRPEIPEMLAALRETAAQAEIRPDVTEPEILAAIGAAMGHAAAGEYNETRSELLAAYHRLSARLHCEPVGRG
ncbi:hypothetical protein [Amycolatopsis anabasis]|uniref:hypothetical protein n=1 Tax=Amycolatopsis anabasis TaxID=1840409 RepID=UPI00131DDB9B|nr:hypothetical protein [Amycolatopsis anabasis]